MLLPDVTRSSSGLVLSGGGVSGGGFAAAVGDLMGSLTDEFVSVDAVSVGAFVASVAFRFPDESLVGFLDRVHDPVWSFRSSQRLRASFSGLASTGSLKQLGHLLCNEVSCTVWPDERLRVHAYDRVHKSPAVFDFRCGVPVCDVLAGAGAVPFLFEPHVCGECVVSDGAQVSNTPYPDLMLVDSLVIVSPLTQMGGKRTFRHVPLASRWLDDLSGVVNVALAAGVEVTVVEPHQAVFPLVVSSIMSRRAGRKVAEWTLGRFPPQVTRLGRLDIQRGLSS